MSHKATIIPRSISTQTHQASIEAIEQHADFRPVDQESSHAIDRMTGVRHIAEINQGDANGEIVGTGRHILALGEIAAAQGTVAFEIAKSHHRRTKPKEEWILDELGAGMLVFESAETNNHEVDWTHIASIADDSPKPEITVLWNQEDKRRSPYLYHFDIPEEKIEEQRETLEAMGITADADLILAALVIRKRMNEENKISPNDLKNKPSEDEIAMYNKLPESREGNPDYLSRALAVYVALLEAKKTSSLTKKDQARMIKHAFELAKAVEHYDNRQTKPLIAAKIGLYDAYDKNMPRLDSFQNYGEITEGDMDKLHGSIYVRSVDAPTPVICGQIGLDAEDVFIASGSSHLFTREQMVKQGYTGFRTLDDMSAELNGSAHAGSLPKIPGAMTVSFPRTEYNLGVFTSHAQLLIVDPLQAPGVFTDLFLDTASFTSQHPVRLDSSDRGTSPTTIAAMVLADKRDRLTRKKPKYFVASQSVECEEGVDSEIHVEAVLEKGSATTITQAWRTPRSPQSQLDVSTAKNKKTKRASRRKRMSDIASILTSDQASQRDSPTISYAYTDDEKLLVTEYRPAIHSSKKSHKRTYIPKAIKKINKEQPS